MAKSELCKKMYIDKEGKEHYALPENPAGIVGRKFTFANGEERVIKPGDFPKNIQHGALLTGLGYVGAASLNNAEGDVKKAVELFDTRIGKLMEGLWSSRPVGSGVHRDSLIVAAVFAAAAEAGRTVDEDKVRAHFLAEDVPEADRAKVRTARKADWRKRADVEAHYQRIRAERAAEAAEKAGKSTDSGEDTPEFSDF